MGRIKLDSINQFARQGYAVRVTCECGHVSDWNAVELMGELARRQRSLVIERVERALKCSNWGKRQASMSR